MDNSNFAQVLNARKTIDKYIYRTPIVRSSSLDEYLGCETYWKLESVQVTNAFKIRGALNYLLNRPEQSYRNGVVAASSGNHGIGIAYASKLMNIPSTTVMPVSAPKTKQNKIEKYGAKVVLHGNTYDEAQAHAKELAESTQSEFAPSFDHILIIAGQGTIALEILEEIEQVDDFLSPIGGGGLISGLGTVVKEKKPLSRLTGVQIKSAPSSYYSLQAGKRMVVNPSPTIADGLVVAQPGAVTFPIMQDVVDEILLVDDEKVAEAIRLFVKHLKVLVEPAGAVTLAAILTYPEKFYKHKVVGIVTGGNIDNRLLLELLAENVS